jgi:hypothetical protein
VCELSQEHLSILLLVVEFQALVEVLEATLVLVLFALRVDGKELVELDLLLVWKFPKKRKNVSVFKDVETQNNKFTLLLGAAKLLNGGAGGVQVEGAQKVTKVDGVDAIALVVVDGESEFGAWKNEGKSDEVEVGKWAVEHVVGAGRSANKANFGRLPRSRRPSREQG